MIHAEWPALAPWRAEFETWLDADEQARAARFAFERDRLRHVLAHGLLRGVLALQVADGAAPAQPASLAFATAADGKPLLCGAGGLCFNLSHAGERVALAVARGAEVGVDIERIVPGIATQGIAERFFTPAEVAWIAAGGAGEADARFTRCWARKEAVLKAWGAGLRVDLDRLEVAAGAEPPARVAAPAGLAAAGRDWWLLDLPVDGAYRAALAGDGAPPRLRRIDLGGGAAGAAR